jgi:hypothetical protein
MMDTNENALAAGQANESAKETTQVKYSTASPVFPYYENRNETAPAKFISLDDLAYGVTFGGPRIGPKETAPLITPFKANGKKKDVASVSDFYALVSDHDNDDKTRDEIRAVYDPFGIAYFAFTSANHEQEKYGVIGKRWKVVIPLADRLPFDEYIELAQGAALHLQSDKAQSRAAQGFYAPNILTPDAPFDCIDATDCPLLKPSDTGSAFVSACLTAYKADQEAKQAKAKKATPKPRPSLAPSEAGIIDKVCQQYDLDGELQRLSYKRAGSRYRSPESSSGIPGIVILTGDDGRERCYSHHGETDPLSNLNNDGHALDVFDVICLADHGGDVGQAVAAYAPKVDQEGQKQRQRDHMAAQDKQNAAADAKESRKAGAEAEKEATTSDNLPPFPEDLSDLPHGLGELQSYVFGTMIYPSLAAAGFTALALYTSLAQTHLTINGMMGGLGFNEQYMMLGGTGSGKEGTRKPFGMIHKDLKRHVFNAGGMPQVLRSAPSSKQGLHKHLEENNSLVMLSDEFGEWLCTTESGSAKQEALGYLMEIYSSALESVHPGGAVKNNYTPVENPRVMLYTTSTAERMLETMSASQADSGSYNRFVILAMGKEVYPKRYEGFKWEFSRQTMEPLEWLVHQAGVVDISPEAWERFKAQDQAITDPIKHADPQMGGRLGEQAIKLAGLGALSDKRMTINANDMDVAFALRVGLYKRTKALFDGEGAISNQHITTKAADQIRSALERKPVLYRSQLPLYSRQYKQLSVAEQNAVVVSLIEDGSMRQAENSKSRFTSHLFDG